MEKLVLLFLAVSFLLRSETNTGAKIKDDRSAVNAGTFTCYFFSEKVDTPAFRTDDTDGTETALAERPVKREMEITKGRIKNTSPAVISKTIFHTLIYDLPPPYSFC
jgi:hypothetical protein